jgi:Restriction endonuclease
MSGSVIRLPLEEHAALSRIAKTLSGAVTNGIITQIAFGFGFPELGGSNKIDKIRSFLGSLLSDGRSRTTAGTAIETIVVEAIHRTVAGKADAPLMVEDVDAIVADLKVLGLPAGALARPKCRIGLKSSAAKAPPVSPPLHSPSSQAPAHSPSPRRHDPALAYMAELLRWEGARAQQRGREFEKILHDVLQVEGLNPTHNIVNTGEQIDLAFVLDGGHYLIECRWELNPQGLPALREFSEKVRRKAEGTFGILVSMSGFVGHINETASFGNRLNCVGVGHVAVLHVLEGRKTLATVVRSARAAASIRSHFFSGE